MDASRHRADEYDLLVVEDACQAQGAEYQSAKEAAGRRAGSFGKAGAFSFYPGKNLGACGEAGAVTTDDEQVARTIKMLREHGQVQKYYHDLEGYNGRLDAIQAAFLRIKLRHLDGWNESAPRVCRPLRRAAVGDARDHVPFEPDNSKGDLPPVRDSHCRSRRTRATTEDRRHPHRAALSAAGPSAELLQGLGLQAGRPAGHRAAAARFCRCRCSPG